MAPLTGLLAYAPEAVLALAGCALLLASRRRDTRPTKLPVVTAVTALCISGALVVVGAMADAGLASGDGRMFVADGLAVSVKLLVVIVSVLGLISAAGQLRRAASGAGEAAALVLFADLGAFVAASAAGLAVMAAGVELLVLAVVVLIAWPRGVAGSSEAALAVFVPSAVLGAVTFFGVSLVYGALGSLDLGVIHQRLEVMAHVNTTFMVGVVLVACGLLVRVAAAPFYLWLPEVVKHGPTRLAAFTTIVPTLAGLAALIRLFDIALAGFAVHWWIVPWAASVVAMLVGNLVALAKDGLKQILGYLWVAHAGYALIGLVAGSGAGAEAMLVHAGASSLLVLGAFTVVASIEAETGGEVRVAHLRGLGRRRPVEAGALLIFLAALAGLPLTAGFVGRWLLLATAIAAGHAALALLALLASVVGALRCATAAVQVILGPDVDDTAPNGAPETDAGTMVTIVACAAATLFVGIWPGPVLMLVKTALGTLG